MTLQTRKPTEDPLCPVSHRTANTISLANDTDHDLPYGIVIPRTHTPSLLRASILHRLTYLRSCAFFFGLVSWPLPSPGLGMWLSDKCSRTRTFGSVTTQIGGLVFSSDVAGSALYFSNRERDEHGA